MGARKTGFDKFFDAEMRDPAFARAYEQARREVDAVDRIVRALDEARVALGISKAELARLISAKPEIVRRLLTTKSPNPTLATVVRIAEALGYTVQLVASKPSARGRAQSRRQSQVATLRGKRSRYSSPSARTSA